MTRKSVLFALLIVLGLTVAGGTIVALLVRYEPRFYRRAGVSAGKERQKSSGEFVGESVRLIEGVANNHPWTAQFTEEQINSYFEEDFIKQHGAESPLPEGISSPRISFEQDKIRLAFRYGKGLWSTVVSIDTRAWLVLTEPNVVALEFQGVHVGALPVSAQTFLETVSEFARQRDIDSTWYRFNGHPVLLLRFQANRSRPTFQLHRLEVHSGRLVLAGRPLDTTQQAKRLSTAPESSAD